ncbi:MetQ/NlpA family ABC transporter substrate-binding protein [Bacillus sp. EB106-08-02-XG196]|jgi:D-methionine transport system substrate-binding protein|uniref:MetQ/NlpA family ABC transporter substrate-binding protein n=1 Tax=Bacillus sp. EB106-08-02-XG196 TaxID=2737049 RepID=UPI0015C42D1A|nr:MetQ/NlpA family ABC transporter substrate-binding protein [Bacillus sp. EB106-08-02-XG196]NWQ39602.1 MetQ/NlpA family ABC transporter substrate-binding protein [Bacillus sp. EB106-08-02-XG196]
MKKLLLSIIIITLAIISAACAEKTSEGKESTTVKLGVSGTDTRIWDFVAKKAEKEGINIEIVSFSDYVAPNTALAEGEIDVNAFQTVAYFDVFIKEHNLDLVPIATTVLAPMGIYSEKYKDVKDIPDGAKIALPNDASNQGRALLLLQEAGLIELPEDFDPNGDLTKIKENPKNIDFVAVVPAQTPRALPDVAASVINNGIAGDAGLSPLEDAIFVESETATPYLNIIAVQAKDNDNKTYKRLAELYQSEDTAKFIEKEYKGNMIPTFVPLSNIGW